MKWRGSVYIVKSSGPSTGPCGTPYVNLVQPNLHTFTTTVWVLSERYGFSQDKTAPVIPSLVFT